MVLFHFHFFLCIKIFKIWIFHCFSLSFLFHFIQIISSMALNIFKNVYNGCKAIIWIGHHSFKPNSVKNLVFFLQFYMMLAWIPPSVNLCLLLIIFPVWILKELRLMILKNCFSQKQQLAPLCNNICYLWHFFLLIMLSLMLNKLWAVTIGLPTLTALIRFLLRVGSQM